MNSYFQKAKSNHLQSPGFTSGLHGSALRLHQGAPGGLPHLAAAPPLHAGLERLDGAACGGRARPEGEGSGPLGTGGDRWGWGGWVDGWMGRRYQHQILPLRIWSWQLIHWYSMILYDTVSSWGIVNWYNKNCNMLQWDIMGFPPISWW